MSATHSLASGLSLRLRPRQPRRGNTKKSSPKKYLHDLPKLQVWSDPRVLRWDRELPLDYEIIPGRSLLRTRAWGVLTHAEATAHRVRFTNDPAFQPEFYQLYDLREVTRIDMTAEQLQEIASYSSSLPIPVAR